MGGVSFHRPASRYFRVYHAKGYVAIFSSLIHNFWLYLRENIYVHVETVVLWRVNGL